MKSKKEMLKLIENGEINRAIEFAIDYAKVSTDTITHGEITELQGQLNEHTEKWSNHEVEFSEFARNYADLVTKLKDLIAALPYEPDPSVLKKRIKEGPFKWRIFYIYLITKLIVLGWAFFLWSTAYGFSSKEAFSLFSALLPGMIIYTTIMFRNLFKISMEGVSVRKYLPRQFKYLIWGVFIFYISIQFFLTVQKVEGNLDFEIAILSFTAVETGLGQFMSELTDKLFK